MRRLIVVTLLAGCATAVPYDDPCACVIIPDVNGALSLAMGSEALTLDSGETTGITGTLLLVGLGTVSENEIGVSSLDGATVGATWGPVAAPDLTAPAAVNDLYFVTTMRADTEFDGEVAYGLGPQGGTMRLREIVPEAGGYRVRGGFSAQACVIETGTDCITLSGNFAFSVGEEPVFAAAAAQFSGS